MKKTTLRKRWDKRKWGLRQIGIYMTKKERTEAFDFEAAQYCSQNQQDCLTCGLCNYGRDCHNNEI